MKRPLNRIIARGIVDLEIEDEYAQAVARFEGWTGPARNHRRRVWQALAENTDRKHDHEWTAIAMRLFAFFDGTSYCDEIAGYFMRARYEGERQREVLVERGEPIRTMRMVRREAAVGRVAS